MSQQFCDRCHTPIVTIEQTRMVKRSLSIGFSSCHFVSSVVNEFKISSCEGHKGPRRVLAETILES